MRGQLIALATLLVWSGAARAHALFPGQQVVYTAGERGIAYFQGTNDRSDVLEYRVELFDYEDWAPTRYAVPSMERLTIPRSGSVAGSAAIRRFTVMVDLDGRPERTVRVCTKSMTGGSVLRQASTSVNTRVCSKLVVRRLQ